MTCNLPDASTHRTRGCKKIVLGAASLLLIGTVAVPVVAAESDPAAATDAAAAALADPAAAAPTGPWSGNVRLGYLATTGNTETSNANFAFGVDYLINRWTHGLTGSAVGASQDNETTAEAYTLGWRSKRDLTERDYLFGRADWLKDKFSGYDQQFSQAVGYGRRVIMQPHQTLNLEIGPGARQSTLRNGDEENEAIVRLGANYAYLFNERAQFNFDLGVVAGEENTFTEAVTALKTDAPRLETLPPAMGRLDFSGWTLSCS